jgi:hypothetical protein
MGRHLHQQGDVSLPQSTFVRELTRYRIAQASRSLKAVMPAPRNASSINLEPLQEVSPSSVRRYTSDAIQHRGSDGTVDGMAENSRPAITRYELQACDGGYKYLHDQCLEIPKTLEELRSHLLIHCNLQDHCSLCPEDTDSSQIFSERYNGYQGAERPHPPPFATNTTLSGG